PARHSALAAIQSVGHQIALAAIGEVLVAIGIAPVAGVDAAIAAAAAGRGIGIGAARLAADAAVLRVDEQTRLAAIGGQLVAIGVVGIAGADGAGAVHAQRRAIGDRPAH